MCHWDPIPLAGMSRPALMQGEGLGPFSTQYAIIC